MKATDRDDERSARYHYRHSHIRGHIRRGLRRGGHHRVMAEEDVLLGGFMESSILALIAAAIAVLAFWVALKKSPH